MLSVLKIPKNTIKKLTCIVDYAYPNTRVRAWKGSMLRDEDLRGLASAKHLEEFVGFLEQQAQYKKDISKITRMDIYSIENLLLLNYINQSRLATDISPRDTNTFFSALISYYEVELIKLVLNKFDEQPGKKIEVDASIYSPILSDNIKKFIKFVVEAKNKEEAINLLKETKYGYIPEMPIGEQKTPGYIASALDRKYYLELWDSTKTLSGNDAAHARKLIGSEVEMLNIITILRSNVQGFKAERFLIPIKYGVNQKISALAGKNLQEITSALLNTPYKGLVEEGMKNYEKDKSFVKLEIALKKNILAEYRKVFKGSSAHIGTLLGFLKLKEFEVKNTRAIAIAIDNGLNQKDIMELVVL